eukprot:104620_1
MSLQSHSLCVPDLGFTFTSTYNNEMCDVEEYISDNEEYISDNSNSDMDGFQLTELLYKMSNNDENICLAQHGYKQIDTICLTLQGELITAETTNLCEKAECGIIVAIKQIDKDYHSQNIAIQDGISVCVEENICKEAKILKHLTLNNKADNIVKYIDYFESENHHYLVMEHIENAVTLKQFVQTSHRSIKDNTLSISKYLKSVKYILWQITTTICWLQSVFKCCHLDLHLDNIMLTNGNKIKICDFGVAEFFSDAEFKCVKQGLTIDNEPYISPQIRDNDIYHAGKADTWALGMIMYECIIGQPLYQVEDMWDSPQNGFIALTNGVLKEYLTVNNLLKHFRGASFSLLNSLLAINETNRLNVNQIIQQQYFKL